VTARAPPLTPLPSHHGLCPCPSSRCLPTLPSHTYMHPTSPAFSHRLNPTPHTRSSRSPSLCPCPPPPHPPPPASSYSPSPPHRISSAGRRQSLHPPHRWLPCSPPSCRQALGSLPPRLLPPPPPGGCPRGLGLFCRGPVSPARGEAVGGGAQGVASEGGGARDRASGGEAEGQRGREGERGRARGRGRDGESGRGGERERSALSRPRTHPHLLKALEVLSL